MTTSRSRWLITIGVVIVIAGILLAIFLSRPRAAYLQGQVEATQYNISSKIPARVDSILVREGDTVVKGQIVVLLNSPEVMAKAQQAHAAFAAARAQSQKANAGARPEEIEAARHISERAGAAAELAEITFKRVDALFKEGVLAEQKRDEAETNFRAAKGQAEAARLQYEIARAGARTEDKSAASALEAQARGAQAEVSAAQAETRLVSPVDGQVVTRVINPGELAGQGTPIVTVINLNDIWITFNIREDRLKGLSIGDRFNVRIPALNGLSAEFEVSAIAPLGDFATWRATHESGDFDRKTFEVRGRPVKTINGLRPGMSVILPWRIER